IREMKKIPDMIFVIDTVKEKIAVQEARRLGIKVVAPLDTNCDPDLVDLPIPGNDDAIRSVRLFCKEMSEAMNEGREIREQDAVEDEVQDELIASEDEKAEVVKEAVSEDETAKVVESQEDTEEK
ncbi:MAG: 30S ribosomal protein S2, partial [Campylobacteraceae bacterium]|nr:30S ribosomal protein S2 [Campylobacteraceae bacterium]